MQGTVAEIPYNGKTLYLDLNALPGDPRDENPEGPRIRLRLKGTFGWEWLDSQQTQDRRVRHYLATLLKDRTFANFYRDLQTCLRTSDPACLTPFLAKDFSFRPPDRDDVLTRDTFAEYGWADVASCFLDGRPNDARPPTFTYEFFACAVGREGGGYVIAACDVTE